MAKQNENSNVAEKLIQASPTKQFFISMITKDISLIDAIGDLIDNSVDGATRTAKQNNLKNFISFEIKINFNKDSFEIQDNCGGIDIKIARKYAFRFGRPTEYKIENFSIGQFGIGMKRAFFKIGNNIKVKSVATNSKFETKLYVKKWQDEDIWNFPLTSFQEDLDIFPLTDRGTIITITALTDEVKDYFKNISDFETKLIDEISKEHLYSINKGIVIKINEKRITPTKLSLIYDNDFKPAYWTKNFSNGLSVELIAGISDDQKNEGGWYIFCNHRLITGPNTSAETGWTGSKGDFTDGVALYHDQFYRFRGYAFFEAEDASLLPWTTTKTGVDMGSSIYRNVRAQMIIMMKPIMSLMNRLKKEKEKDSPKAARILNNRIEDAKILSVSEALKEKKHLSDIFIWPQQIKATPQTGMGIIRYQKPYEEIVKVKKYFGVTKNGEVGEKTFDFFYDQKIGR